MSPVESPAIGRFWVGLRRRWRRFSIIVLCSLAIVIAGGFVWRWTCLRKLPDVGDPFDVPIYQTVRVPDSANAFALYRKALGALTSSESLGLSGELRKARSTNWRTKNPRIRDWIDGNREALLIWRQGSERPEAFPEGWTFKEMQALNEFPILALVEAARLREEGDMAEAWNWYRAIHRMSRHYQRRGGILMRMWGRDRLVFFRDHTLTWAADPRVSPEMLRKALNDVLATENLVVSNRETLKAEYVQLMDKINDPAFRKRAALTPDGVVRGWEPESQWYRYVYGYETLSNLFRREPERSRRVVRLVFTNWMMHADGVQSFRSPLTDAYPDLFVNQPTTVAMSTVHPSGLSDWLVTTRIQDFGMPNYQNHNQWREKERTIINVVIMRLAAEMYERDNGKPPGSDSELVGPYLDRLPPGHPEAK